MRTPFLPVLVLLLGGCAADGEPVLAADSACRVVQPGTALPAALGETSGVTGSRRAPGVLWSHNDSGDDPRIYALDASGGLLGAVRVAGASNRDWEDIAAGPCPAGDCLYIADTGDNQGERDDAAIYRVPEPDPGAGSVTAERFPVRFPEGPRDAEAVFVMPSGDVYVVTKGRSHAATLYRYPAPLRADERVTLEPVARFGQEALTLMQQVTGADAAPGGEWVAVRTYGALSLHRARELLAGDVSSPLVVDLTGLFEPQGEAVTLDDGGRVVLTSEGVRDSPATLTVLDCALPE